MGEFNATDPDGDVIVSTCLVSGQGDTDNDFFLLMKTAPGMQHCLGLDYEATDMRLHPGLVK